MLSEESSMHLRNLVYYVHGLNLTIIEELTILDLACEHSSLSYEEGIKTGMKIKEDSLALIIESKKGS